MSLWKRRILLLWLLLVLQAFQNNADGAFVRLCSLGRNKLETAMIDDDTGEISLIEQLVVEPQDPPGRLLSLQMQEFVPAIFADHGSNLNTSFDRTLQDDTNNNKSKTRTVLVRECTCNAWAYPGAYCIAEKDTCGLTSTGHVGCFNQTTKVILLRNAWPIVILWYASLFLFILFTTQGRNARQFVYTRCCNRHGNEQIVQRILHPPPNQMMMRRRRNRRRRRRNPFWDFEDPSVALAMDDPPDDDEDDEENQPRQLALKTKRFVATKVEESGDDGEEPPSCTICFSPLEDGERVGALPCEHVFHAECLKTWISRRNVCPLCLIPNVATPHSGDATAEQPRRQDGGDPQRTNRSRRSLEVTQDPEGRRGGPFQGRVILRRNR